MPIILNMEPFVLTALTAYRPLVIFHTNRKNKHDNVLLISCIYLFELARVTVIYEKHVSELK